MIFARSFTNDGMPNVGVIQTNPRDAVFRDPNPATVDDETWFQAEVASGKIPKEFATYAYYSFLYELASCSSNCLCVVLGIAVEVVRKQLVPLQQLPMPMLPSLMMMNLQV
jgi:hypothetical protein